MTDRSNESNTPRRRPPRIRLNAGAWSPLVDMIDVFPGHRGSSRHEELELYDAPLGIRFEIEEAVKSEPILQATMEWEGTHVSPLYIWQRDGRYHLLYDSEGGQCYAVSDDAYNWTRTVLNEVEFNGSSENNLLADSCKGATGIFEDPNAPPEERFKAMGGRMYWWDPDTGEELSGEEPSRRIKAEQEQETTPVPEPRSRATCSPGHRLTASTGRPSQSRWRTDLSTAAYRPVTTNTEATTLPTSS